jgi:carboxymethylenebutenolidase
MTKRGLIKSIWEEHKRCEFELKSAEATMETMTANPFINNIPTMIGGHGYDEVYHFYKHIFLPYLPKETEVTSISCTIDDDRLVDEQIFRFVHDSRIDFMLPNIEPTGKTIVVPLVVIVSIEQAKVAREHIYWDQASVLKQLGLLTAPHGLITGAEQAERVLKTRHGAQR